MSNFIRDFLEYHSGTECHKNFLRWAAVSTLGTAAGLRYRLQVGGHRIYPLMYIIFVGAQGVRKSYAKSMAKDLIEEAFPDYPVGADVTTRDDIMRYMASDVTERAFVDSEGCSNIYHPLALFINEFKHFLSYNPAMMISFIVDIYDYCDKTFKGSTIKRGEEHIMHPFLSILACENTDWLVSKLKDGIITGGFSRRFIVVYEDGRPDKAVPIPYLPDGHEEIRKRMISHLQKMHTRARNYIWTPLGLKAYTTWYEFNFKNMPEDPVIAGFKSTKDQQLLKLCILLDLAESEPTFTINEDLINTGLVWFDQIEPNMPKLYASAGRNQLALPQQRLLELIESRGGIMSEKEVMRLTGKDLSPQEQFIIIKHLTDTDMMIKKAFPYPKGGTVKTWLITSKGILNKEVKEAMSEFTAQY